MNFYNTDDEYYTNELEDTNENDYIDYNKDSYYKDIYSNYDNDDYSYFEKKSAKKSFYDEDEEDDEDSLSNQNLEKNVDDDLVGYFADARMFTSPKKKLADTMKKKPKKIIYKSEDKVIVSMNKVTNPGIILFGPYEVNKKQMYQIELDNGNLIEADDKHIKYSI